MKTLVVDPGSQQLGWCIIEDGEITMSGTRKFKSGNIMSRLADYQEFLEAWRDDIMQVVLEAWVNTRFASAVYSGVALNLITKIVCTKHNIPLLEFPPTAVKKYITGNGRANKDAVQQAVHDRGLMTNSHDEADAIALAFYFMDRVKGETYE